MKATVYWKNDLISRFTRMGIQVSKSGYQVVFHNITMYLTFWNETFHLPITLLYSILIEKPCPASCGQKPALLHNKNQSIILTNLSVEANLENYCLYSLSFKGIEGVSPHCVRHKRQLTGWWCCSLRGEVFSAVCVHGCKCFLCHVYFYMWCERVWGPCVCLRWDCVPQQLRIGLFLSGLNGNTGLSVSAFPLWGPSVATAWKTTPTWLLNMPGNTNATRTEINTSINE